MRNITQQKKNVIMKCACSNVSRTHSANNDGNVILCNFFQQCLTTEKGFLLYTVT